VKEGSSYILLYLDTCETFSASDVTGQDMQKRAPTRWQVALTLYILPSPCVLKGSFAIAYLLYCRPPEFTGMLSGKSAWLAVRGRVIL